MDIKALYKYSRELNVLYVEDDEKLRNEFFALFSNLFKRVDSACDGLEGLLKYRKNSYNLVITDINMPNMNGIEMTAKIHELNAEQKIIAISAHDESDILVRLIKAGIQSIILKPIIHSELVDILYRVSKDAYAQQLNFEEMEYLHNEIVDIQKEVLFSMGSIGERRSRETGSHVKRVAEYSQLLASLYGLPEEECRILKMASPMHDIGKVGIPDEVLNKPGMLTEEEWEIMKTHALLGYEMLKNSNRPIMKAAAIVAKEHHEKWDGSGYPDGKAGEAIHIYGRITAICDVFDALSHDRCYKKAWPVEEVLELLKSESAQQFDPNLIELFFENLTLFLESKKRFDNEAQEGKQEITRLLGRF